MRERRVKHEFGRLTVGIVLLGLAIFLASGLDSPAVDDGAENPAESVTDESSNLVAGTSPEWQAPEKDAATAPPVPTDSPEIARPVFQPPTRTLPGQSANTSLASSQSTVDQQLNQVPTMNDQYRAMAPFQVTGTLQKDSSLVPVQPKPGFTGKLTYAGGLHRVRSGDTLQSIASEYYGSADRYLDIYLANRHVLANPARLPEGIELRIPE